MDCGQQLISVLSVSVGDELYNLNATRQITQLCDLKHYCDALLTDPNLILEFECLSKYK